MTKVITNTGVAGQPIHTRTTSDSTESQAVVIGIDGSDSVLPADATFGLGSDIKRFPSGNLNADGNLAVGIANTLVPRNYDYISLGYTGADLTTVLFKQGGSGGTLIATLTLAYTSGVLQSVTKT